MAILVTGGSSGIGRAIAERLARSGSDVFITYNSREEAAREASSSIEARGARAHIIQADMGRIDDIRRVVAEVQAFTGSLDVVVHAAARAVTGPISELTADELDRAVTTNGTSIAHLTREALPLLKPGASVVFVTSKGSERALKNYAGLGAPKALGEHLVRYLATELAGRGIRFNSISPGPVDTEARRHMFPDTWHDRLRSQIEANPSGRGVEFDDIANLVELITDPRFTMVQGQTITVDGGLTL